MPKTPSMVSVRKQGRKPTSGAIDALLKEAWELRYADARQGIALAEQAQKLSAQLGYEKGDAVSLRVMGFCYFRLSEFKEALTLLQQANRLFLAQGDRANQASTLNYIGIVYRSIGEYDAAADAHFQSLHLDQSLANIQGEASSLNNLGIVFGSLEQYERSIEFFQKSLALYARPEFASDKINEAFLINNLGNAYFRSNRFAESLEALQKSLALKRALQKESGKNLSEAVTLNNIGLVYDALEDYDSAYRYFHQSLAAAEPSGVKEHVLEARLAIGKLLAFPPFAHYSPSQAVTEFQFCLALATEMGAKVSQANTFKALAGVHKQLGDTVSALAYYEKFYTAEREVFNEAGDRRTRALQIRYEVEQKEKENEVLRLRSEKLEQETSRQKQELVSLAMALVEKNEFIDKLKIDLAEISTLSVPCETKFADMLHQLDRERSAEQSWKLFEQQFSGIYGQFIARLTAHCNTLTPVELKIAALLKLNLATKDIARALNTSPRTVDNHRHRLRAKLRLKASDNITSFLSSL